MINSKEMAKIAVKALEDKKAEDIKVIDISNISVVADYFIIANGTNTSQIQALVDNVQDELAKNEIFSKQVEGYASGNWVLIDYSDIIVHVFSKEDRLFYDLERIWKDGKEISTENL